ncbi:AAA family ATPase [Neobacillus kokaensis]|uniref:ATPase AAA-type core domain-containing protein n=1 Tax=Neobacillus kokaensis TaxID=2759023 RepID=A0ABQ3N513_9BACI|nr:AAA family ATPase [Neobacillus kokaensis]GHH99744.1 hypothetical protein AM1BK_32870 [Neobacillus kokaensis]
MELVYLWIEQYRNISQTGYSFSNRFKVNFNKDRLSDGLIIADRDVQPSIFNDKVTNITAIIGINGSGKTNVIDLLGMRREDRFGFGKAKYFIVYHLEANLFAIEGSGTELISSSLDDFPEEGSYYGSVSNPYSIVVKKIDDSLIYNGFLQLNNLKTDYHKSLSFLQFRYNYDNYSYQSYRSFAVDIEDNILFSRLNLNKKNTGNQAIYKMLVELNHKEYSNAEEKATTGRFKYNAAASLIINLDIMYNEDLELPIKKFHTSIDILRKMSNRKPKTKKELKEHFLNKMMYNFAYYIASYATTASSENIQNLITELKEFENNISNEIKQIPEHYYTKIIEYLLERFKQYNNSININTINSIFKEYIIVLNKINEDFFGKDTLTIPLDAKNTNNNVLRFLQGIDSLEFLNDEEIYSILKIFKISYFPLSSGESALLSLFSALYFGLTLPKGNRKEKLIILLDEPELSLHPEWNRVLIDNLIEFLNDIENGYETYQLIITTHSPFLISDIPSENIIAVTKDNEGEGKLIHSIDLGETFASDIHTLLSNEFFMSSTIGSFAKRKINEVIKFLNDKNNNEEFSKGYIDYIISIVGEPLIKKKLKKMRDEKYATKKERQEKIAQLKAQLRELEAYDSNSEY